VGSTLVSLCSGPIVKGSLGQEDPRSSSGPREIPMATGQDHKNKKPRARFRGRGRQSFEGVVQVIRSPRTSVRSFSACAWKSTPAAFAALRVVPGAPKRTERKLRRAAAEYRANLVVRDIITELFLL